MTVLPADVLPQVEPYLELIFRNFPFLGEVADKINVFVVLYQTIEYITGHSEARGIGSKNREQHRRVPYAPVHIHIPVRGHGVFRRLRLGRVIDRTVRFPRTANQGKHQHDDHCNGEISVTHDCLPISPVGRTIDKLGPPRKEKEPLRDKDTEESVIG